MMGSEKNGAGDFASHPSPLTPHGEARNRIRWHCRRGLLELDLVLARFVELHLEQLSPRELEAAAALLAQPDMELWELIGSAAPYGDEDVNRVLGMLRHC
ncbi:MAG: succinate dehydrogenase assembly factor 2 [Methanoregulaceae archaeon]|nr:succinate dehydrogenase assembly factor 2 [Methanoregulaceae archaeon]